MVDVFQLRNQVVGDYSDYIRSFLEIRDPTIRQLVEDELHSGRFWPDPLVQLNPSFRRGETLTQLVGEGVLHEACQKIFRRRDADGEDRGPLHLYQHQVEALRTAHAARNYVLTTSGSPSAWRAANHRPPNATRCCAIRSPPGSNPTWGCDRSLAADASCAPSHGP